MNFKWHNQRTLLNRLIWTQCIVLVLLPSYFFGQVSNDTVEIRLTEVEALIDATKFDEALLLTRKILSEEELTQEITDTTLAKIYNFTSSIFVKKTIPDSAIHYANKALEILSDKYENHYEQSQAYNYLGSSNYLLGNFREAINYFKKGLEIIIRNMGDEVEEVTTYYGNLSLCYNQIGEPHKALEYLDKNLDILLKIHGENHVKVAKSYNNLGAVYYSIGDFDKSLEYSFITLRIKENLLGKDHPSVASTNLNIGSLCQVKGDFDKSRDYTERGIQAIQKSLGPTHPYLTFGHKILGSGYMQSKNFEKAIHHYRKGIEITEANYGKDKFNVAGIYFDLAALYKKMNRFEEAEDLTTRALNIFEKSQGRNSKDVTASIELLAGIYLSKGAYDQAIDYYKEALEYYANQSLKGPDRANTYLNIGAAYTYKKEFGEAKRYFDLSAQALFYDNSKPFVFDQVTDRIKLRRLLDEKRDYFKALYQVSQNAGYLDSILQNDLHGLALEEYFQRELSEQEARTFYLADAFWRYEGAIENLIQLNESDHVKNAFEISEKSKSRLLAESFRSAEARQIAGISEEYLEKEHQINVDLAYYDKQLFKEEHESETPNDSLIALFKSRLFDLKQDKEEMLATFRTEFPSYHKLKYQEQVVSIEDVQELLNEDQTLIEYFVGDSSVFIFVISSDDYHLKTVTRDFPLEEWVVDFREKIYGYWMLGQEEGDENRRIGFVQPAYQLYEKLISPIEDLLTEQLIIVPDGLLNFVPFEALISEIPGNYKEIKEYAYLIKKYQISYNYSATLFNELSGRKRRSAKNSLLAFAPEFKNESMAGVDLAQLRSGFGALRYNVQEAEAVHELLGGDIFTGHLATEEQFHELADQYQGHSPVYSWQV